MPLDVAGQAESSAEEQEHAPGQCLRGLPVHHEVAASEVHRDHEEQERAGHRDGRVGDQWHGAGDERPEHPAARRQHEHHGHGEFASPYSPLRGFFGRDQFGHPRKFASIEREHDPGQHEVHRGQRDEHHRDAEQHPLTEADGHLVDARDVPGQERVRRSPDQCSHSSRRCTIGDGQEQRRAEPPHLRRLVGPIRK